MTDDNELLTALADLEGEKTALAGEREAAADENRRLKDQEREIAGRLNVLTQRILDGESTRDPVLDLQVRLSYKFGQGASFEKDDAYRRLSWLFEQVLAHPGELVIYRAGMHNIEVGVLPLDPSVGMASMPSAHVPSVSIPVVALCTDRVQGVRPGEILVPHSVLRDAEIDQTPDLKDHPMYAQFFVFGVEAAQAWLDTLKDTSAVDVWAQCRAVGQPLEPSRQLWQELQVRREGLVAELVANQQVLAGLTAKLALWQRNPEQAFASNQRFTSMPITGGVAIDFGLGPKIKEARAKLEQTTRTAGWLGMGENATYRAAAKQLGDCPRTE